MLSNHDDHESMKLESNNSSKIPALCLNYFKNIPVRTMRLPAILLFTYTVDSSFLPNVESISAEAIGRVTGTTSRIGGGLIAGNGFWCDDAKYSSSSLSDSKSQTSDDGDSGCSGWWSASTTKEVDANRRSLRWTARSGSPATGFVMYTC